MENTKKVEKLRGIYVERLPEDTYYELLILKAKMRCANWTELATKLTELGMTELGMKSAKKEGE